MGDLKLVPNVAFTNVYVYNFLLIKSFVYSKNSIIFVVSIVAVSRNIQLISLLRGGAATSKPY